MSRISENGDSLEKFRTLQITSLDEEEEEDSDNEYPADTNIEEDDDDDEEDEDEAPVTLGFVEKPKKEWSLLPHLFPSKAGGFPAWLDPINLPSGKSTMCGICGEPLQFLLQAYAPLFEKESTFHRTLFVFMCPSMKCLLRDQHEQCKRLLDKAPLTHMLSVKVFRCQLPRSNLFYSAEPPRYDGKDKPSEIGAALCSWCGTWKGDKVCSSCKRARYCCEKHQAVHWRSGHRDECQQFSGTSQESSSNCVASEALWPQFEIVNEDEPEDDTDMSDNNSYSNALTSVSHVDEGLQSMVDVFKGDEDNKSWASFQARISRVPEQVLRYCRYARAKPLWPMSSGRPSITDIPKCSYCGGPQCFELQILPQLLYYFGVKNDVDSLDWATIVVYTCETSCVGSMAYKEEYAWVQLPPQSTDDITKRNLFDIKH